MLGDNLKAMRKAKGYTQEELAIRLNVVRQTVSKWEKGISVPDADALAMLADVLDTDVSALLGDAEVDEADKVSIAEQLARINEQFAVRNSRSKARWKIVGIVLVVVAVLIILLVIINTPASSNNSETGSAIDLINSGPEQIRYGDRMIDKVGLHGVKILSVRE